MNQEQTKEPKWMINIGKRKHLVDALASIRSEIRKHNKSITTRVQVITEIIDNAMEKERK
jgi:hypothetical protein